MLDKYYSYTQIMYMHSELMRYNYIRMAFCDYIDKNYMFHTIELYSDKHLCKNFDFRIVCICYNSIIYIFIFTIEF